MRQVLNIEASLASKIYAIFMGLSLICVCSSTSYAQSQTNGEQKKPKTVQVEQLFVVQAKGRVYACGLVRGRWMPGVPRDGNGFITLDQQIKVAVQRMKTIAGPQRARLERRVALLRRVRKEASRACKAGPPAPVTAPKEPTAPPQFPVADALRPLSRSMFPEDIDHLFSRAALGFVDQSSRDVGLRLGVEALVTELSRKNNDAEAETFARSWLAEKRAEGITTPTGIKYYALLKLILTKNPLLNHLCMIHLHDILAVSVTAVPASSRHRELMLRYFDTLCSIGDLGSYRDLIKAITIDPAMLYWLDGASNNRLVPNENYSRELLELFTVGVFDRTGRPNYNDLDVATAARALTGFGVLNTAQFGISTIFNLSAFDTGKNKLIFRGTTFQGNVYDSEQLIDHIFDNHPNTAYNVALMLAERYLRPDIAQFNPRVVQALADDLTRNNFNLVETLEKLLVSEVFYEAHYRNAIVRSPAELTVHLFRALHSTGLPLDVHPITPATILSISARGGHELGDPPTVFGWDRDKEFAVGSRHVMLTNMVTNIFGHSTFNNESNLTGWNYFKLYPPGYDRPSTEQVIDHMLTLFGVSASPAQKDILYRYLNTQLRQVSVIGQQTFVETPDPWDPTKYGQARRKLAGVLRIVLGMKEFRVY